MGLARSLDSVQCALVDRSPAGMNIVQEGCLYELTRSELQVVVA